MHLHDSLRSLRTAIPFIRAYKGRVFVIKLGGALCAPGRTLDNLAEEIALLYQLGIKVVVVHGGGPQADAVCEHLGLERRFFAGRRLTDAPTLSAVKMAFAGTVNTDVVAALRRYGVPGVGLSGIDERLLVARKRAVQNVTDPSTGESREIDFGFVGDIVGVSIGLLRHLLTGEYVPVICSLAADDQGQVLNVNADTAASRIAVEIGAAKYFLVTSVDGVLRNASDPATLLPYLDVAELDELIESGAVSDGMLPKLSACVQALLGGVSRVHIVNGTSPDTLLTEVFTNEGCGTLLVRERGKESSGAAITAGAR